MASLKLTLFGSPQVELNGERLTFKTRKALALLAYLVVGQQPHSRETLAALFWPEFSSERAFANLRGALRSLTQPLGDSWFDIRRHEVQVRDAPTLWVDVLEFQQLLAQLKGHEHLSDTICEHCCASLLAAIDLYQDDFLRGFTLPDCPAFDEWQSFQTDLLREQLIACFQKIIAYATAQRDLLQAIEYARRWVAVCPWSEAVHRELMWVYALNSQRSEALQQYQTCVRMLRDEFEAEPEQETRALYDAIVNEELTSGLSHPTPLPQGEGALLPSHLSPSLPNRGGSRGRGRGVGGEVISPNNLPAQTTSFIGREAEVAGVMNLLSQPDVHLLTLTGPGGSGKTRLGLQVATRLLANYEDGVFFVSLAPISNPDLVVSTMVTTLGLQVAGNASPLDVLKSYVQQKHILLVLDNFEQILAIAPVLNDLLAAAPGLKIIVTSRTVLRISGEHEYLVPPLTLPDLTHAPSFDQLTRYEAVQLFAARASAMQPHFTLTAENTPVVAHICVRLDGLPLAIELAAARINMFSPQMLLNRLKSPLHVLTWGVRDLPTRQQTLRNTITWSYDLLNTKEQTLFRRLAVFVGGWTLEAAEAVCAIAADVDVLNGVQALVDHNLATHADVNGEPRCTMLETIREYALERLAESSEEETIRQQHAQFFMALAEEAEQHFYTLEQAHWFDWLDMEHNNLRAALAWAINHDIACGLRIAGALGHFWHERNKQIEGRTWLGNMLTKSQEYRFNVDHVRPKALRYAGILAYDQNDMTMGDAFLRESVALCRKLGDKRALAHALLQSAAWSRSGFSQIRSLLEESILLFRQVDDKVGLGTSLFYYANTLNATRNYERARSIAEEALILTEETGDMAMQGCVVGVLGYMPFVQNDYAAAQPLFEKAVQLLQQAKAKTGSSYVLFYLGESFYLQGDYQQASILYNDSMKLHQERGDERWTFQVLTALGYVSLQQERWQEAHVRFAKSLPILQKHDKKAGIARCLTGLAGVFKQQGQLDRATQLLGFVHSVLETIETYPPFDFQEPIITQAEYTRIQAAVCSALGEEAFETAYAKGRAMTLEQAVALALENFQRNNNK